MKKSQFAIISDVSANLEALTAVLNDIKEQNVQKILCLGDLIGHGPNPLECVKKIKETSNVCLCGHIEYYVLKEKCANEKFSSRGKKMIDWTRSLLQTNLDCWHWLSNLKTSHKENRFTAVHSDPRGMEYKPIIFKSILFNRELYSELFQFFDEILLIGGNHKPWFFTENGTGKFAFEVNNQYHLQNLKTIISVGSVGQPHDGDARACYAILSNNSIVWRRVNYDIEKTAAKINQCDALSKSLGLRLFEGR